MTIRVERYSGFEADQWPLRFWFDDHEYAADGLLDQWYGPDYTYFRMCASDGRAYILRHVTSEEPEHLTLASFSA
jgi:hypothetical protein